MKTYFLIISLSLCIHKIIFSQVAINESGNNPDPSAALELDFNNKGLLIPRLTTSERDNIANPANSLIIFNKTTKCFEVFLENSWQKIWCNNCSICPSCQNAPTNVTFLTYPYPPCNNQNLTLMGVASNATHFLWTGPNGFVSTSQNIVIENFSTSNAGIYTFTAINDCGSTSYSQSLFIGSSIPENITATANPTNICLGDTLKLTSTGGNGATNWFWNGPNGFFANSQQTQINTVLETHSGIYSVTASNHCGQKTAQTQNVTVNDCPAKCTIIGGLKNDIGSKIISTIDNSFVIIGHSNSFNSNLDNDIYLIKLDHELKLKWTKIYGSNQLDIGYSIFETDNKDLLIAGVSQNNTAGFTDIVFMKVDSLGNIQWLKNIGGPNDEYYAGLALRDIIKTNDNHYLHLNLTRSYGSGFYDGYLIKFNENGNILWNKAIGRNYYEYLLSVVQTSDNSIFLIGNVWVFSSGQQDDIYLVKLNNLGEFQWAKRFFNSGREVIFKMVKTSDNGFAAVGFTTSFGSGERDVLLIKLNNNGNLMWAKAFGNSFNDEGFEIIETSDGGFLVAGYTTSNTTAEDILLFKTSSTGSLEWAKTINKNGNERGVSIAKNSFGEYALLGNSNSYFSEFDILIAKFTESGINCCMQNININETTGNLNENNITTSVIDGGIVNPQTFNTFSGGIKKKICN